MRKRYIDSKSAFKSERSFQLLEERKGVSVVGGEKGRLCCKIKRALMGKKVGLSSEKKR